MSFFYTYTDSSWLKLYLYPTCTNGQLFGETIWLKWPSDSSDHFI